MHHFSASGKKVSYGDISYFEGKDELREKNLLYANRCRIVVKGLESGRELEKLIQEALEKHPIGGTANLSRSGESTEDTMNQASTTASEPATNLILYGPPGTGKTFNTVAEAVRLCGELIPQDRVELMTAYRKLVEAGRIEFITFHQSMSYEEFVEGLRPETPSPEGQEADSGEVNTAGFRLKVEDGVFKRICERARLDPGKESGDLRLDRKRPIFKVSLGRRGQEETQIKAALDANKIRHGWGGTIDWSNARFDDWTEIKTELENNAGKRVSAHAGDLVCTYSFRSDMQVGDYVVVSDGRDRMRAFGKITGDYSFDGDAAYHPHNRSVEWLWRDDLGEDRARFYPNGFRQHTVYKLNGALVDWDGLEGVVLGVRSLPVESACTYVLIIDEINRANISKVFGELITLLESDKRLRADNEIQLILPYSKRFFGVPSNLHVIGTMNTADRSIALLDTALRRRFTFHEMMPDASVLEEAGQKCGINLPRLLATINERIEYLYDREHQIGHAYFTACRSQADVDEVMRHKVIPLLAEYFFEDWAKIAAVLGDLESHDGGITGGFLTRSPLKAPPGLEEGDAVPRYRWEVRSVDEGFNYGKLVGA
ncbi:AAA family ATPase [Synechococcus sp. CS-1325]|uniref:AAA family ATPase n=1 Tax=Synechococcus sp. CS-1327 TaxID=2847977 RepID=UPI00223BC0B5|nr:AAA family ATPase [Synechococcus sp. CS-1327]MCT0198594.1 AAA family ATPase [Synechococcus sp. CS-1325]MCT0212801.1 AAA family ATPase [Synechococcus sp. CS-1326]MCT0232633.1 AAA family ATPase [Synechococcus sp. CS-1327]